MTEHNRDHATSSTSASSWRWFLSFFNHESEPSAAHKLYGKLVNHARFPFYFRELGVADTPEGRFEILALHVGLAVRRLMQEGADGREASRALVELMVADLDVNLRELGVGDLSVGKQVNRLAAQFNARQDGLQKAFDSGDHALLRPMLATNVYHGVEAPPEDRLTRLIRACALIEASLAGQPVAELALGRIHLPDEAAVRDAGASA